MLFKLNQRFIKTLINYGLLTQDEINEKLISFIPPSFTEIDYMLKPNEEILSQIPSYIKVCFHDNIIIPENITKVEWTYKDFPKLHSHVTELTFNSTLNHRFCENIIFTEKDYELIPKGLKKLKINGSFEFKESLFERLDSLEFFSSSEFIPSTYFPNTLKVLRIAENTSDVSYLTNLEELWIKYPTNLPNVKRLKLVFEENVEKLILPETIEELFLIGINHIKIKNIVFPKNLKKLEIRYVDTNLDNLPQIEELILSQNQASDFLPNSLKKLDFQGNYINLENLPPNVKVLELICNDVKRIPHQIEELNITQGLKTVILPPKLKKLDLSSNLNEYWIDVPIEHLVLYSENLRALKKYPKKIKTLEINCGDGKIVLPKIEIKELILQGYEYQEIINIPPTTQIIKMKETNVFYHHSSIPVVYE